MKTEAQIASLEDLLDRIADAEAKTERVSIGDILDAVGRRSFGPLLLFTGLVTLSPVGDIPGVPSVIAVVVLTIGVQALAGRNQFWLPDWLLKVSVARRRVETSVRFLRKPARFVDHLSRPRLQVFTYGPATYAIAMACLAIALAMPPMEVVPFTASGAGTALTAFGLALVAHDGLLAILAFGATIGTLSFVIYRLV